MRKRVLSPRAKAVLSRSILDGFESLESRILLSGSHDQQLLSAISSALQPGSAALAQFNSRLTDAAALGRSLPLIGNGLNSFNPGTQISSILSRVSSGYSTLTQLASAVEGAAGAADGAIVNASRDLPDDLELDLGFSSSANKTVAINANFGSAFTVTGSVNVQSTLTESLTVGAYWDTSTSLPVFYVSAPGTKVQVASSITGTTLAASAKLGFVDLNVSAGSAIFSPTFSFSLNDPTATDASGVPGRITTADLITAPFSSLVTASLGQASATSLTATISTNLAPTATSVTFTWADINDPSAISSNLNTDSTLASLSQLENISPATISAGLDLLVGDLAGSATSGTIGKALATKLPLINKSIDDIVDFPNFFKTYLTSFTDAVHDAQGIATSQFTTGNALLSVLQHIPNVGVANVSMLANGSKLVYTLHLPETINASFPLALNVGSALNFNVSGNVNVSLVTNTNISFGIDASSGIFFINAPSSPVFTATATLSANVTGSASLGFIGVSVNNGTVSTTANASISFVDPQLDSPASPGIITSTELSSDHLPSLGSLATVSLTGSASASMPISTTVPGINPQTLSLSWPDVNSPTNFNLNTAALSQFLDFNQLSWTSVLGYLKQLPTFLTNLAGSTGLGKDIAFVGSTIGKVETLSTTLQGDLDSLSNINTLQDLQTALQSKLGLSNFGLSITGDEVDFTLKMSQNYSGSANWSFGTSFGSGLVSLQSSGTVPINAAFNAQLKFGLNLTPQLVGTVDTATASDRFFIVSASSANLSAGSSISAGFNVQGTGLNATGTVAFATIGVSNGTVTVAGTDGGGNIVPASNANISLVIGDGTAGDKLTLTQLLANPSALIGPFTFNGAARAVLPLTGLPAAAGTHPQVQLDWTNLSDPSTIAVTPNFDPSTLNPLANFDASSFFSGITSLIGLVQQWDNQPVLQTNIPFINKPIKSVIDFAGDVASVLQKIKDSGATTPAALESAVLNSPQVAGFTSQLAEIQKGVNDNIANANFDYVLKFHDPLVNIPYTFDWGNSLFSLNGSVYASVNFATSIEFGFNKTDGFYIVGTNDTANPQLSLTGGVTGNFDRIGGMFGPLSYGVSNGTANIAFGIGLNLSESSTNGAKIPATDIITNATSVLHPFVSGSGSLNLPIGLRLGSGSSGPAVTTTFSATWDPKRSNPLAFGANNSDDPTNGFSSLNYDIGEFINGIIGPVLNDIQQFNPIPQSVFDTLNTEIPVINKTIGEVLGDYLNNPGLKLLLNIGSVIGQLPTATPGNVNLSTFFPAGQQPNTGDTGGPNGGVAPAGDPNGTPTSGNFGVFKSFSQTLKNNFYLDLPILDNPSGTIIKLLTGKDVDLVTFDPGAVSISETYSLPEISVPIVSLGVAAVNAFISGNFSATLFANINLGLSTRGIRGEEIGGGGVNLLDGFYVDDSAQYQAGINLSANINIGGSVSVFGYDAVQLYGTFGAFGQFGVHVNDVFYNPATHVPVGIANYAGNGAGDNRVYLDELSYISGNYGALCAIMPTGELGLNVGLAGKVNFVLGSITLFSVNSQIILVNYNYPCVPVLGNFASIQGNQLVINSDPGTTGKTFSANIHDSATTGLPDGVRLTEYNNGTIVYQDFTFAQLSAANVHTLVMNGTAGDDIFKIDPNVTKIGPIQNLVINSGQGNDAADLGNLTSANSALLGVTINGGDGNDTFKGNYAPDQISLGNGANTVFTGIAAALIIEHAGNDTITSGDGNVTVNGGTGPENILLGNGNNLINAGSGSDTISLGDGNNIINAGSGAEQIRVGHGKNYVAAGSGSDTITTGDGDNKIFGDNTASNITVGNGQNIIYGGAGNDSITAGSGNNFINAGGGTNTVQGGTGSSMLEISGNGNMVLLPGSATVTGGTATTFTNITSIGLTGGAGNNSFDVSGWNGAPVQISGAGGTDTVIASNDVDFTVTDSSLSRSDGVSFALTGISAVTLTGGTTDNVFDLTNWHGSATLNGLGGIDTLKVGNVIAGVLTAAALTRSGAGTVSFSNIERAQLTTAAIGSTSINAGTFTGDVALFGQGGGNTLTGGTGSDYIVGGDGSNVLVANGTTNNQLVGGTGSTNTITGGPGANLLVGSTGGFDVITSGSGNTRIFTPGGHATIHAETGRTIVYAGGTGDTVANGSATTNQTVRPGDAGTTATDFVAPSLELWEFPVAPTTAVATLPTGTDSIGQWVEYAASASAGGVSNSAGVAIEPAAAATGSGASAVEYIAWADNRTGVYQIYVAKHTNGTWTEIANSAHGTGISGTLGGRRPSITLDATGNPIVAWTQVNGTNTNIEVVHFNSGTGTWAAYGSLAASTTNKADNAKVVNTAAGPVVAWLDTTSGNANVYVASSNGTAWSALGTGATTGTGVSASASAVTGLSLATDGTKVAVSWTQTVSSSTAIFLKQYSGSAWAAVNNSASGNGISGTPAATQSSVAYFGGNIYIAYASVIGGTTNIAAVVSGASSWTAVSIDTPTSAGSSQISRGAAYSPALAASGGGLDLVWFEDRLNTTPNQAVAIYANRLVGGAFKRQLPGDASFDGILGRSTSISSATALALAVDSAGHPYVAWGDSSSGSSQIYALGNTLDVTKVIYVNDSHSASDSYTTADGAAGNDGLTPATPVNSIAAALALSGVGAGTVILVDGGTYAGFTLTSATNGVTLLGAPGAASVINTASALNNVQNVTLRGLTFSVGITVTGGNHIELSNVRGGNTTQIAGDTGGSLTISGSSNVTVEHAAFNGITLANTTANVSILSSTVSNGGINVASQSSGLLIANNTLRGLTLSALAQGSITGNTITKFGLGILAAFTGAIQNNSIHNASTGVTYSAAAQLSNNRIFNNGTGVTVSVGGSNGLGFIAGSLPNLIYSNGLGVSISGSVQGQHIYSNGTGVYGNGTLGGTSLDLANLIEANSFGVQITGTIQFNRIARNNQAIGIMSGNTIAHNLFYNNNGSNIETLGASDVRIFNNTFTSTIGSNVVIDNAPLNTAISSNIQLLNNILSTSAGYDIYVNDTSRSGFFSDYNDLSTTGTGKIIHWLTDFTDVLDWQTDVHLFDLHSIGTTVVNPSGAAPQFINAALGDYRVYSLAGGLRSTSPTLGTGDPSIDVGLPGSYTNLLSNPSFESGLTSWNASAGSATRTGSPTAFDGSNYYTSGSVASGSVQQTISLTSAGFTTTQLDSQSLVLSFGGRIRSASESPADQGTLTLTFLDGSNNPVGTADVLTASNVNDRWELIGDRVHVPTGARSVVYKFTTLRQSGGTDDSYLDNAYVYVLSDSVAGSMGGYGNTATEISAPGAKHIQLQSPDLYVNWELNSPHIIRWQTFGNDGGTPVAIDLYQDVGGVPTFVTHITTGTNDTGTYTWIPANSGLSYGMYGLRIQVSLALTPAIYDRGSETFTIPENGATFYVNDRSTTGDEYTTAAGNNRATGKLASAPLPLLTTLFREYSLDATSNVEVDTGTYNDFASLEISGNPSIGTGQGVTITGAINHISTISALGFTAPAVFDINAASFVTLNHLTATAGNFGFWVHNGSLTFSGNYLTATGNSLGGVQIESDSTGASLDHIITTGNGGSGIYVGGNLVKLTNSTSSGNASWGAYLNNTGSAMVTGNTIFNNHDGLFVYQTTANLVTTVGTTTYAPGLGNLVYNNTGFGIEALGNSANQMIVAGNTVYGQTNAGDYGISTNNALVTGNIVYNNYENIRASGGSVSNNRVYGATDIGIILGSATNAIGDTVYNNRVGIESNSNNSSAVQNNVVYGNSTYGIWLYGGENTLVANNTVYQIAGTAIQIDTYPFFDTFGINLTNNILYVAGTATGVIIAAAAENGFHSDYNDIFTTGSGQVGIWENLARPTLQSWQFATQQDANSLNVDPQFVNLAGSDFHEQSTVGSYHGGSIAPVLGGSNLPVANSGTLTADVNESAAIDRGDSSYSFANEVAPNGGFINLGAFGNTAQASKSPTSYVLILKPATGSTLVDGQTFTIVWRSQDTAGTVNIDLMQQGNGTPVLSIASSAANSGTYSWTIPANLAAAANYQVRITRNTTAAIGTTGLFTINGATHVYYVNDNTVVAGDMTTAPGNDANSGLDPAHPKASVQAVLSAYTLGAGDIIEVDRGLYETTTNIVVGSDDAGVTIQGFTGSPGTPAQWESSLSTSAPLYSNPLHGLVPGVFGGTDTATNLNSNTSVSVSNTLGFSGGFTFEAWLNPTAGTNATVFDLGAFDQNNSFLDRVSLTRSGNGDQLVLGSRFGAVYGNSILTNNTWQFLTVTMSSTGTVTYYLNGDAIGGGTMPVPAEAFNKNDIGDNPTFSSNGGYTGGMEEAAVFARAETPAEIRSRYLLSVTQPTFFRGNLSGGSDVFDINAANVTLKNVGMTFADIGVNVAGGGAANGLTLSGVNIYHTIDQDIFIGSGDSNLSVMNSSLSYSNFGVYSNQSQVTISGSKIFGAGSRGLYLLGGSAPSLVTGSEIFNNNIGIDGTNYTVTQSKIHDNPGWGVAASFQVIVTGNTIYNNFGGQLNAGVYLSQGLVTNNVIYGNGWGIFGLNAQGTANNNLIYGNSAGGIQADSGTTFTGNVVHDNTGWGIYVNVPNNGSSGGSLYNNIVYGNSVGGIQVNGGVNTFIINNTVYQTVGDAIQFINSGSNVQVRNNILWTTAGADLNISNASQANVASDYNDLYLTGTGSVGISNGVTYTALSDWATATGIDVDSISANPLFVNLASNDYHEQSAFGSYHGGSLAPALNGTTGLPTSVGSTLTNDASTSPALDAGSPTDPFTNEPVPNGGYINLGAYGNSAQASLSAPQYLTVQYPQTGQTVATGQTFAITWRTQDHAGTVKIDLLDGSNNLVQTIAAAAANSGSYAWNIATALSSGNYKIRITRSDGAGTGTGSTFAIAGATGIYYVNDGTVIAGDWTTAVGNNSNTGLDPAHPKASVAAILAAYQLQPGNIIMVDNGTYTLPANITLTAADSGITIQGFTGAKPILNRGNTAAGAYAFGLTGGSNITIQNFEIINSYAGVVAGDNANVTNLTVKNLNIHLFFQDGVYLGPTTTGAVIDSNTIHDGSANGVGYFGVYGNSGNGTVTNNTIYDLAATGIVMNNANHSTISGNTITSADMGIQGDSLTITNNTLTSMRSYGINVYNATVTSNTIHIVTGGGFQVGIYSTSQTVATNNVIDSAYIGIRLGNTGSAAIGNRVFNNGNFGIEIDSGANALGNIVYSNAGGISTSGYSDIRGNLIYSNTNYGISVVDGFGQNIYNNTIYQPTGNGIQVVNQFYSTATYTNVYDNIIWTQAGPAFYVVASHIPSFFSNFNDIYTTGTGTVGNWGGKLLSNFTNWVAETALDPNSIAVDPKFVNPAGADGTIGFTAGVDHGVDDNFQTQSGSPTIDAGEPSADYSNEPSPNGSRLNLGYTGNTALATKSAAQSIQIIAPVGRAQVGQTVPITWNTSGMLDTSINSIATTTVNSSSPIVYLKLDENSGAVAVDSSGNGRNGVYNNNPALAQSGALGTGNGTSVGFDGGTDDVTVTSTALNLKRTVTLSAWIKPTSYAAQWQPIFYKGGGAYSNRTYTVFLNNAGFILLSSYDGNGAGERTLVTANGSVPLNAWTHVAVVMDRNTGAAAIYLNGTLAASAAANAFPITDAADSAAQPLYVGYSPESTAFRYTGLIDEAAVFGTALSASAINAQYNASKSTFNIDLINSSNVVVQSIATNYRGASYPNWTIPSNLTPGTYQVRVTSTIAGTIFGLSQPIMIVPSGHSYYINDNSLVGDATDTAVGNNANDGKTPNSPMASITAVLNLYHPGAGDTIFVENGTYTTQENITLRSYDSGLVIQGPTTAGTSAVINRGDTSQVVIDFADGTNNITIDHLKITGGVVGIDGYDQSIGVKSIVISNSEIYGNADTGIYTGQNNSGWLITGSSVHDNNTTGGHNGIYINNTAATITNNTVFNEGNTGITINAYNSPGSVISGNTVYANGTGIYGYGVTIIGNLAHDNGGAGINVQSGSIATGNIAWRNGIGFQNAYGEIRNNVAYGNGTGIYIRNSTGGMEDGNRVYSNTNYGIQVDSAGNERIFNNLVYNNSNGGIYDTNSYYTIWIYNNTVYQPANNAVYIGGGAAHFVENNVLWVEAGADIYAANTAGGFTSDYNDLHTGTGANANVGYWNGTTAHALSDWKTTSNQDAHSIVADPKFVNPAGVDAVQGYNPTANSGNGYDGGGDDNFILAANSPAIAAGTTALAPPTDLLGQSRSATGPIDLGAYAFTGSNTDITPPTITAISPAGIGTGSVGAVSSITVRFSEPVNPVDASAVAEYDLRSAGADAIFNTGDDVVYVITPGYTPGGTNVTLNFQNGPLPNGSYRLQILSAGNATIHDLSGLALDGDANGSAGGTYSRTFSVATAGPLTLTTPVQYVKLDADGIHIDVYTNSTGTGTPTQYLKSSVSTLTINQTAGASSAFILDLSAGNPLPTTVTFTGNGTAGLQIIGSATASDTLVFGSSQITVDGININLATPGPVSFKPGTGGDNVTVNSGTLTLAASTASTLTNAHFATLNIANGGDFVVAPSLSRSARYLLTIDSLTLAGSSNAWTGKLDLNDNDAIIHTGNFATLTNQIRSGLNLGNGYWNGTGILSTSAHNASLSSIGLMLNIKTGGAVVYSTFDGQPVINTDVLLKYTYYGDADLNGVVNGNDYTQIDNAFSTHSGITGWSNGDLNFDNIIDGSDYSLIDNAFNRQGTSLAAQTASEVLVALSPTKTKAKSVQQASAGAPQSPSPFAQRSITSLEQSIDDKDILDRLQIE